jgi:hypothetical protein
LNILQKEVQQTKNELQKEKRKWIKANERIQSRSKKSKSDSSSKDEAEESEP